MTERELQRAVVALIKQYGLRYYAVSDSRKVASCRGYPDLTIAGPGGVLFRELKVSKSKMRPEQDDWIDLLTLAGESAGYWWPADLDSGKIESELAQIAPDLRP